MNDYLFHNLPLPGNLNKNVRHPRGPRCLCCTAILLFKWLLFQLCWVPYWYWLLCCARHECLRQSSPFSTRTCTRNADPFAPPPPLKPSLPSLPYQIIPTRLACMKDRLSNNDEDEMLAMRDYSPSPYLTLPSFLQVLVGIRHEVQRRNILVPNSVWGAQANSREFAI